VNGVTVNSWAQRSAPELQPPSQAEPLTALMRM